MTTTNLYMTVLEICNVVQRKLGLSITSTLTADSLVTVMVDHLNDAVTEISDYGRWRESLETVLVTAVSGQADYNIAVSGFSIVNIGDCYFSINNSEVRDCSVEDMRRYQMRSQATGTPRNYTVTHTTVSGNPTVTIYPTPATAEVSGVLNFLVYSKPGRLTTSDANTIVRYPAQMVIQRLLAKVILDEEGGAQTDNYTRNQMLADAMLKEAYSRFNGNSGYEIQVKPSFIRSRGRR